MAFDKRIAPGDLVKVGSGMHWRFVPDNSNIAFIPIQLSLIAVFGIVVAKVLEVEFLKLSSVDERWHIWDDCNIVDAYCLIIETFIADYDVDNDDSIAQHMTRSQTELRSFSKHIIVVQDYVKSAAPVTKVLK